MSPQALSDLLAGSGTFSVGISLDTNSGISNDGVRFSSGSESRTHELQVGLIALPRVTVNNVAPEASALTLSDSVINEDGSVTVTGSFSDVGIADTHTVTIDWGDGNTTTADVSQGAGAGTFTATYSYPDDGASPGNGTPSDVYTITATITDDDGGTDSASADITVNNVAPIVAPLTLSATSIDENGSVVVSGSFTDVGTLDQHSVVIDWGDGNSSTALVNPTTRTFSAIYTYLDDGPSPGNGTSSDVYTITATVTDDDGGTDSAATDVTVNNVAPTVTSLVNPAEECGTAGEGETIEMTVDFADIGSLDAHSVTVNWGDGSTQTYSPDLGDRSVGLSHAYTAGGIYNVTITVADDDGGTDSVSTIAVISGAGIQTVDGEQVLQIIGTSGVDEVSINQTGNGQLKVHWSLLGDEARVFSLGDIDRIMGLLCDGDDHLTVSGKISLPTMIDAGDGNDHVKGGGGSNVILGGDGEDHIVGGSGRDILIGGLGADRIVGGAGMDIITGGVYGDGSLMTAYDALKATQSRWLEDDVADLMADGDPTEDAELAAFFAAVGDDEGAADLLTGSSGFDWVLLFENDTFNDDSSNGKGKGGGKGKK